MSTKGQKVTPTSSPWSGLEVGKTDARRVDARGKWHFFWTVMPRADVALVLRLGALPDTVPELPSLKSLDVRLQMLASGPVFFLRLKDGAQIELFETLCRDVVAAGEQGTTEADALRRAIRRTFRWHSLLRGGRSAVLSEEEQKGLIGELEILRLLVAAVGAEPALAAWMGPAGAPKDFELTKDCIEVKARRSAAQPFVRISNEHQLADVPGRRLWLAVVPVDGVPHPEGSTLTDVVEEIAAMLEQCAPSILYDWELRLTEAGYDADHDYSNWRWSASIPVLYAVVDGFPKVTAPVPVGVSDLTYSLALTACAPFVTDWATVVSGLSMSPLHE